MDLVTLHLVNFLISILFAILITVIWLRQKRSNLPGQWVIAEWLTPLGLIFSLQYFRLSNPAWIVASAMVYWLIFHNHLEALRRFAHTPNYTRYSAAIGILMAGMFSYLTLHGLNESLRIMFISGFLALLSFIVILALIHRRDRDETGIYRMMIGVYGFQILFHITRASIASQMGRWDVVPDGVILGAFYLELLLFKVVSDLCIIALIIQRLQNRLNYLAHHDDLTELPNRRFLVSLADRELMKSKRSGKPCSLLMIDLDHFKNINDRYGHAAGDRALFLFSAWTRRSLRQGDVLARLGGEEFCAFLPATDIKTAVEIAERLRAIISANVVVWDGQEFSITTSIGVASTSKNGNEIDLLLRAADQALYRAKMLGRNTVVPALL